MRDRPGWMRGLAVAFALLVAVTVSAQEPVKVQAARRAFNDAYRHEDWGRAVEVGLDLVQMVPRSLEQYNLACVFALADDPSSALYWLEKSAASGFFNISLLEADSDLDTVRDVPGYARVRDHVAKNYQRHRAEILRHAASTPPLTVVPTDDESDKPRPLIIALHGYGDFPTHYPGLWGPVAKEIGAMGVGHVVFQGNWGGMPQIDVMRSLELIGKDVLPHFVSSVR